MNSVTSTEKADPGQHRFPLRYFVAAIVISLLTATVATGLSWFLRHHYDAARASEHQLDDYIGQVMLFDEALTMSARLGAATGDFGYEERYDKFDVDLDALIRKTASALGLPEVRQFVEQTDEANRELVKMERRAFTLASEGRRTEATALLVSDDYSKWKRVYAKGVEKTVAWQRGVLERNQRYLYWQTLGSEISSGAAILAMLGAWYFALRAGRRWAQERLTTEAALRKAHNELELRVQERTAALQSKNLQFDAALNNMVQGLLMFDSAGALIISNRRFTEMFGLPAEQWQALALGLTVLQVIDLGERLTNVAMKNQSQIVAELQNILDRRQAGAIVFERTDGRTFCASCSPMADGGFVITFEDTTEQRRTQDQISHMAHYDALTDLPNRAHFYEEMDELLKHLPQSRAFAVLSLDLDHFKNVNDTLGHPVGDKLLQAAAERMRGCIRETDIVARLGGDEFAILQLAFERPAGRNLAGGAPDRCRGRAISARRPPGRRGDERRHCNRAGRRNGSGSAYEECGSGALPLQGRWRRHVSILRSANGRPHAGAPRARARSSQGVGQRRIHTRLSAHCHISRTGRSPLARRSFAGINPNAAWCRLCNSFRSRKKRDLSSRSENGC